MYPLTFNLILLNDKKFNNKVLIYEDVHIHVHKLKFQIYNLIYTITFPVYNVYYF